MLFIIIIIIIAVKTKQRGYYMLDSALNNLNVVVVFKMCVYMSNTYPCEEEKQRTVNLCDQGDSVAMRGYASADVLHRAGTAAPSSGA